MKNLFVLSLLFLSLTAQAQTSIGIESHIYPAGVIPSIRYDLGITENLTFNSRIGYKFTNRSDWGKRDNEEGRGFGFGLGFEQTNFLAENLSLNFRTDLWFMNIDWYEERIFDCPENANCAPYLSGTGSTDVLVLQPSLGFAYQFPVSKQFFFKPSLSFGYEINVHTEGEEVGGGAILLLGVQFGYFPFAK
ncbi:MAG: hypothetical protein RLN90_02085 [Balneolaceae bacterium]